MSLYIVSNKLYCGNLGKLSFPFWLFMYCSASYLLYYYTCMFQSYQRTQRESGKKCQSTFCKMQRFNKRCTEQICENCEK